MTLDKNPALMENALRATADYMGISKVFVEKDYWISKALKQMSNSQFAEVAVFKGGTSLSKAYNLIHRFSEDIDVAVLITNGHSGNQVKALIRNLEQDITAGFLHIDIPGLTSKGSRFRKSIVNYPTIADESNSNTIIVEINSFANAYPFEKRSIKSFVAEFMEQSGFSSYIDEYNLHPFLLNVLDKRRTLSEKLVSLIRFSFQEDPIEGLCSKVRHFYDLHFLLTDKECADYILSDAFKGDFHSLICHDHDLFDYPANWKNKPVFEAPILTDFDSLWHKIAPVYERELTSLAYITIPPPDQIAQSFRHLIKQIQ